MSCEHAHDDGAYVLGALAPAERAAYERHLAGCPACREAVAEIAVLPGLLGRLDAAGLERVAAPPTPESQVPVLLTAARRARLRERQINRWRYAGAVLAAACLALVVGFGSGWLWGGGAPGGVDSGVRMVAMRPLAGAASVTAEIGLRHTDWGTEVTMRCHYGKTTNYAKAYPFRLVAYGPNGATEQVGSWVAAPGDDVVLTGATRFTAAELARLELTRQDGKPLLGYDVS